MNYIIYYILDINKKYYIKRIKNRILLNIY